MFALPDSTGSARISRIHYNAIKCQAPARTSSFIYASIPTSAASHDTFDLLRDIRRSKSHFDTVTSMRALLFAAVIALPLVVSSSSAANKRGSKAKKVALIGVEISGDGPPELRQVLQRHIVDGLKAANIRVNSLEQTLKDLKNSPELIGCTSSTCLERIGKATSSARFVRARVTANGSNYQVELQLLDSTVDSGLSRSISESCEVCTISELGELVARTSEKLLEPQTKAVYDIRISTNPSGARISINGDNAGSAPLSTKLTAGLHTVSASLSGRSDAALTINVESSEDIQPFALALGPAVDVSAKSTAQEDYGAWKWGAAVGSGGLLVLGGVLLVQHGDPVDGKMRGELKDNLTFGIGSLSGGVVLGAVAGWMFWREHKTRNKQNSLSLTLGPNTAVGQWRFSF